MAAHGLLEASVGSPTAEWAEPLAMVATWSPPAGPPIVARRAGRARSLGAGVNCGTRVTLLKLHRTTYTVEAKSRNTHQICAFGAASDPCGHSHSQHAIDCSRLQSATHACGRSESCSGRMCRLEPRRLALCGMSCGAFGPAARGDSSRSPAASGPWLRVRIGSPTWLRLGLGLGLGLGFGFGFGFGFG